MWGISAACKISVTFNTKITDINAPVSYLLKLDNELWFGIWFGKGSAFIPKPGSTSTPPLGIKWCPDQKHFEVTVDDVGPYILSPPPSLPAFYYVLCRWGFQGWCNKIETFAKLEAI